MKPLLYYLFICLAGFPLISLSQSTDLTDTPEPDNYLMFTISTNYSGLNAGSTISIIKPGAEAPETIKPRKNEDFRVRVVKELNSLASEGWKIVSSHHSSFELGGSSGTTSVETVYILRRSTSLN